MRRWRAEEVRDLQVEAVTADEPRVRIDLEVHAVEHNGSTRFPLAVQSGFV